MKKQISIPKTIAALRRLPPEVGFETVCRWVRQQPPVNLRDRHWLRVFWEYLFSKN